MLSVRRPNPSRADPALVARWLFAMAAAVLVMVVVGGVTRLTESGLSMVHWNPISGAVPPLTHAQWMAEFDAYRTSPQFLKVNRSLDLAGFKHIFFWEYLHRLIGRLIATGYFLVLGWLWWRRLVPEGYGPRLVLLFLLGALQGLVGWIMVASGLQDQPRVSHVLLAVHLLNALLLFCALIWTALDLRALAAGRTRAALFGGWPAAAVLLLGLQIAYGAFTAGLRAGYAFAEWPTMGGRLFPEGVPFLAPWWRNLVDQPIVVQFIHRWLAWVVAIALALLANTAWRRGDRSGARWVVALVAIQIALGISTLLSGVALPIAVMHQANAALLLAATIRVAHRLRLPA